MKRAVLVVALTGVVALLSHVVTNEAHGKVVHVEGASRDYQPTPVINANGASTSIDVQTTARLRNDRGELRAAPVASAGIVAVATRCRRGSLLR